jgi:hypothetical protein
MGVANGFALYIRAERRPLFLECVNAGIGFGEPVEDFIHSRSVPLVCFIIEDGCIRYIGQGRRGVKSGTELTRLNVSDVVPIAPPIAILEVSSLVASRHRTRVATTLDAGGLLTPKSFQHLVAAILEHRPDLQSLLDRYSASFKERIDSIPSKAREVLALQKDALLTALALAQDKREAVPEWKEVIQEWTPPAQGQPTSFLEGLAVAKVREDAMVVDDLTRLPGFKLIKTLPFAAAIFESDKTRVTIVLANRQPLAELLGVDLIYFNQRFRCFVMVQYKAMEGDADQKYLFRIPNEQLDKELERMDKVLVELRKCNSVGGCDGYRLNEDPFFLKLCKRIIFNPDDTSQADGMYLPLGYWRHLAIDKRIEGPKGGKGIGYSNVTRYFDNSSFVALVANAWIGSTPEQSDVLENAIEATIESGKAVLVAIKSPKPPPDEQPIVEAVSQQNDEDPPEVTIAQGR